MVRILKSMPMVVMKEGVKLSSENRSSRQLLPTPSRVSGSNSGSGGRGRNGSGQGGQGGSGSGRSSGACITHQATSLCR